MKMETNLILNGDCIEKMKELQGNSVDAIITDPPYGLEFMGKEWDKFKEGKNIASGTTGKDTPFGRSKPLNSVYQYTNEQKLTMQLFFQEWATECLRVLKPGGFLLAFGGTRTYHRLVCGIEDAGFEIRDTIMWLYGSGFPKSLNIGKQIDKMGEENKKYSELNKELCDYLKKSREKLKLSQKDIAKYFLSRTGGLTGCVWNWENGLNIPTMEQWKKLKELLKLDDEKFNIMIERVIVKRIGAEREVVGKDGRTAKDSMFGIGVQPEWDLTKPATPEAKEWEGWGTALKPACEPIVVARKPLSEKNVALNVLKWGTGGINIDECRIGNEVRNYKAGLTNNDRLNDDGWDKIGNPNIEVSAQGRFPANIILDEEAGKMLDIQAPLTGAFAPVKSGQKEWGGEIYHKFKTSGDDGKTFHNEKLQGASRFFYCAKASKSERNFGCEGMEDKKTDDGREVISDRPHQRGATDRKNNHPTVKPIKLMEYLVKLVSKEGATVLDPFVGSGTTAIACLKQGRKFIGIEKEEEYIKITNSRIKPYLEQTKIGCVLTKEVKDG